MASLQVSWAYSSKTVREDNKRKLSVSSKYLLEETHRIYPC